MSGICFERDGWIDGVLDDADQDRTFTRLRISAADAILTRNYSRRGGGESAAINVPLLPLAAYIAAGWWRLLYEPLRRTEDEAFQARHRLDTAMHGYAFPAVALCSAGDEAVLVDWTMQDETFSPIEFRTGAPSEPVQLSRTAVENELMDLVEAVLDRHKPRSVTATEVKENWHRIQASMSNAGELGYCMAAGRLGLDPYDADAPDIGRFQLNLDAKLFNDISDAVELPELDDVTTWTSQASRRLAACPHIEVSAFGPPPVDTDMEIRPWVIGNTAAGQLGIRLGLDAKPKKAVGELLGAAVTRKANLADKGPSSLTALVLRSHGVAHIGTIAVSARQQRFRACAATYLAWVSGPGEERAGTIALTRRQQASRAFAAEMVAPRSFLQEQAGPYGFTAEDIEVQASNLICPYETVLWQAVRAGIPLRGIELPMAERPGLFGSKLREPGKSTSL